MRDKDKALYILCVKIGTVLGEQLTLLYFPISCRIFVMHLSLVPVQILGYSLNPTWWKLGVQLQRTKISS